MVENSKNCRFILISNVVGDINDWIQSRVFPLRYYPLTNDDLYVRLVIIAETEKLDRIIKPYQLFKIAEVSGGDMRNAIKRLQGLCEGRTTPVADTEIESTSDLVNVTKIGDALDLAFRGEFTQAVAVLDNALYLGMTKDEILNTIIRELSKSRFTEKQKIVIGLAISKIDYVKAFQLYGLLAFIADNARVRIGEIAEKLREQKQPSSSGKNEESPA